jgi:hypothetical protein
VLAALSSRELTEIAAFYALVDEAQRAMELKAAAQRPVERRGQRMGGP